MRRVLIPSAGGYDRLRFVDEPDLQPGPGEIAVAVDAIGVNYADCVVRMGLYESAKRYVGWPITPGFEVAGTVAALGSGVAAPAVGSPVMAVTRFGGYSTRVVVPAHQVHARPDGFDVAASAGFPTVFLTGWFALHELAQPRPGARVLVHSAAGGVGSALVQLAKNAGCSVVGVVGSPGKIEVARALGCDDVIDRSAAGGLWPRARQLAPNGYDVIFDAQGVGTLRDGFETLASPGRMVVYGFHGMLPRKGGKPNWVQLGWNWLRMPRFNPLAMTGANRSVMAFNLSRLFERAEILDQAMRFLLAEVAAKRLRAPPITILPFADVAEAHRRLESGATVGKLVLTTN